MEVEVGQHFQSVRSGEVYEVVSVDPEEALVVLREPTANRMWPCHVTTLTDPGRYARVLTDA